MKQIHLVISALLITAVLMGTLAGNVYAFSIITGGRGNGGTGTAGGAGGHGTNGGTCTNSFCNNNGGSANGLPGTSANG